MKHKKVRKILASIWVATLLFGYAPLPASAATAVTVVDSTTTGTANAGSGHTFTVTTANQVNGSLEIEFPTDPNSNQPRFTLESGFGIDDVSISLDGVIKTLHPYPDQGSADGIGFQLLNTNPKKISFNIINYPTLLSPTGIPAGTVIVIKTGTNVAGNSSGQQIINSPYNGSYNFTFSSANGATVVDTGSTTMTVTGGWEAFHTQTSNETNTVANHVFSLNSFTAVPAGGLIAFVFPITYSRPGALDYTDVDLYIGGVSVPLAGTADATNNGVSFIPVDATHEALLIELNSTTGIITSQSVELRVGLNASGANQQYTNPLIAEVSGFYIMAVSSDMSTTYYDTQQTNTMLETITAAAGAAVPEFSTYLLLTVVGIAGYFLANRLKEINTFSNLA